MLLNSIFLLTCWTGILTRPPSPPRKQQATVQLFEIDGWGRGCFTPPDLGILAQLADHLLGPGRRLPGPPLLVCRSVPLLPRTAGVQISTTTSQHCWCVGECHCYPVLLACRSVPLTPSTASQHCWCAGQCHCVSFSNTCNILHIYHNTASSMPELTVHQHLQRIPSKCHNKASCTD